MERTICQLIYKDEYLKDIQKHLKSGQKKILQKIDALIDEIEIHPTFGTGQPEQLKGYGVRTVWSRRIDQKHRLVYEIFEDVKEVKIPAYGHYKDK
ncbi:MAG: Txe/YoeB family addiction module toxin [Capnocytophaga sp.]|nr:Txe/YoeB family addiction module toxin [Capnocytophaga sp.]